jgi:hypothetical protein
VSGSGVISFNAGQNVMIASGNVSTAGNVSLTSGTGSVNESGAGTISGLLLSTNSATGTTLSNANVVSQFNAINSGLGVISLTNDTPVMITGITQTGTGNVSVNNTGNINLTGTIAAGSSNNLFLTSSGSISETGSGVISNGNLVQTISVGGTLLNAVSNTFSQFNAANTGNGSVQLSDAAALTVTGISESGGGNIDLTDSNSSGITTSGGLFTVSSPATETINITANAMSFGAQVGGTSTGSGSTGTVILQPDTAGSSLGIAGASGTLQLTSTSLNNVYATNVRLGNSTAGNLSVGAFTPTATFASSNLTLDTAGSITQTGALNLGIDNAGLIVRDASSVALTNNGNVLSNIAATVSGAAQFTTSSALTVASLTDDLGTINGMSANNQNISLISGSTIHESGIAAIINTNLLTTSSVGGQTLTNNNAVSSFNATNISGSDVQFTDTAALTVTGISVSDGGNIALTDSNSGGITTTGGLFTVSSPATETINIMANNMSFGAQVGGTSTGNGSTGTVILQPDTLGNSLGIAGASGTLQLTAASLNNVYATNVRLGNSTAGNISVGAFTPTTTFASGNLTLDTAGSITQTGALNLGTDNAGFIVRDASSVALTNSASVLSNIAATVNGAAQWTTSGTLTVAALTDDLGTVNGISANNQNVSLTSGSTINESGAAVITNTNLLTTSSVGGQTLINSNAVSSLNAANNGGVISLTNNAPLNITAITETGTGNITVNNVGDINVTGSIAAGAANTVNLATSGAIAESGSGLISGAALVATSVNGETLGGANAMTSFTATNTNGNAISLINTATPLTIARISQTGTGNVSVNNTGAITLTGTISAGSTNNLVLTSSNTIGETGSGVISSGNLVQTASVGGTLFNAAANNFAQFNASNTGSGNIALTDAATTLNITGISQNGGGSVSLTEADVLSVANGASINSGNAALTITATNLNMNSTGVLNSGTGNITITQNTPSDTIGLGNTSGSMTITGSNLQNIFASNLTLSAPSNGEIIVDGITSANSANISNTVILSAVNGPTASIVFQNNPASFKALTVNSNDGITISHGAPLTTTVGNLVLNLDVNGAGGVLDLNDNVTAAGTLTLNATGGGIILTDPVITGNGGITFNGTVNGSVPVTINSGVNNTVFEQAVGNLAPIGDGTGFSITLNSTGTTSFAESVTANSGISAMGPVIFNDTVMLANSGSGSNFTSSVTLNNPSGMSINGYNGLNFNGGLIDTGGSITVNSNNSALNIAALTLSSAATLNTVGGNITLGTITGGQNLTLNAGAAGNITFNGNAELNNLDIINANIMTNHATINASTFIQQAGTLSNLGNLSNQVLNVVGNASITEGTVNGNINLGSLTLDVGNANLFGTVAGLFGQPAINTVTLLNTITAGTHFLDGIDMFNGNSVSNPSPPLTTTPISIQQTSPNLQQITSSQQINQGSTVTPNVGNVTVENVIAGGNALSSRLNGLVLPSTVAAALNPNSVLQGIASNTFTNPIANTLALPNTIPLVNALPSASTLSSGLSQALSSLETMALAAIDALDNMIKAGLYILSLVNPYTWTLLLLTTGTGVLFLRRKALSAALMSNKTYADMSFKLRTDVNNINGCAQIIYNESIGKVSATQKEFLHDILFGVNDVLQILTNVETNKMNVLSPKLVFRLRTALNDIKGFSQVIYEGMAGAVTNGQREFLLNISQGSDDILQLIPAQ